MKRWLGITWGLSNRFGWGVYGLNLVLELLKRGEPAPIVLEPIVTDMLPTELLAKVQPLIDFQQQHLQTLHRAGQVARLGDSVILHSMGNGMQRSMVSHAFEGDVNLGVIFFELNEKTPEGVAQLKKFDAMIAGSSWNAEVMRSWGVENVEAVFQGVDTDLFKPQPRTGQYNGRFAVFSGGKLDFRKGQDIVLEAFKIFAKRHDDAVLVTAWQNIWPLTALGMMHSPYTKTLPKLYPDDSFNMVDWAAEHGIPQEQFVDLGLVPNEKMPAVLAEMDAAVFPNRCEGGTNLVAMETMACGVPCIIAANTGQMDLVGEGNCIAIFSDTPVHLPGCGVEGWGEASIDEIVEALETCYTDREAAKSIGTKGAAFMKDWAWPNQISSLLGAVEKYT